MRKNIGPITMIAVCFNICNSWAGLSGSMQLALYQGGPAAILYGMIISASLYMAVALTLGELASVYPTAGGQYHFASILAPKSVNRVVSYTCGMITNFSWIAIMAAIVVIPSTQILAVVAHYNADYIRQAWHGFLIYEAFGISVLLYNIFVLKKLPRTHDLGFVLTIVLFLTTTIVTVARSSPKASTEFVWATFTNYTGWPDGVCFMSALLTTCFIFAGLDSSLHLSEEAPNPRKSVPRAAVLAVGVGFATAFGYGVAMLYSVSDEEWAELLVGEGYLPYMINVIGMKSDAAATTFLAAGLFMSFIILNAVLQTASRITWALARDNALAYSTTIASIHPTLDVPVWATVVNWVILSRCGFVYLGSETAFNALLASCVVLQQLSFVFPAILLLYQRRSKIYLPDDRLFRLPSWLGYAANIWVVIMTSVLTVFFMFPQFLPVDASTMNYNIVLVGIAFLLCGINWFCHGRKHYQGPRIVFHD
ncbi:putative choline transport protein [Thozetella sp. PMI_491]|nr:putative choline transport protein [Thozetella sp. PMI_491]